MIRTDQLPQAVDLALLLFELLLVPFTFFASSVLSFFADLSRFLSLARCLAVFVLLLFAMAFVSYVGCQVTEWKLLCGSSAFFEDTENMETAKQIRNEAGTLSIAPHSSVALKCERRTITTLRQSSKSFPLAESSPNFF